MRHFAVSCNETNRSCLMHFNRLQHCSITLCVCMCVCMHFTVLFLDRLIIVCYLQHLTTLKHVLDTVYVVCFILNRQM